MIKPQEHDVVGNLYDAAGGQRSWSDVGQDLASVMHGQTVIIMVHRPVFELAEIVTTVGLSNETLQQYGAYYAPHDVWIRGMENKRLVDRPVTGPELIDDQSFERGIFYSEFLRPLRVPAFHIACSLMTLGNGSRGIIGVHRPRDARAFSSDESTRLGRLIRHVRGALFLRARLQQAGMVGASALAALDRLSIGVILVGATGKVMHANIAAETILRTNDGLVQRDGSVHATNSGEDRRLQALIAGARRTTLNAEGHKTAGGRTRISRPSGQQPYALAVTPVGRDLPSTGADKPAALLFVADPAQQPTMDSTVLEIQFGFTPAEARLVRALALGRSLPIYAKAAGISHHTARTHLKRAQARTGANSQLELVRLVLGAGLGMTDIV